MTGLLAAIAALVPLAIAPGLYLYYDVSPKLVMLLAGVSLVLPWTKARAGYVFTLVKAPAGRLFTLLLACSAAAFAIATALSVNPALSFAGSIWRRLGLLAFLPLLLFAWMAAAALAGRPRAVTIVLRAVAAGGAIIAVYVAAQYFGIDPVLDPKRYLIGEGERAIVRPPATLGYANYAASYLLFALFAGLGVIAADASGAWRWLGRAAAALSAIAIVLSGTRGALAGLAAGAALLWFWRPRTAGPCPLNLSRRAAVLTIVATALLAGAFAFSPYGERFRARVLWSLEEPLGGARRWLWTDTLALAADRPVAGWGPETFTSVFAEYQSIALAQAYPDFYHESPHNVFLDALAGGGILLLLALTALCAAGFCWAGRSEHPHLSRVLAAGLVAMVASHQFIVPVIPTALGVLLIVAMLAALAVGRVESAEPSWRAAFLTKTAAIAVAVVLAVFAAQVHWAETGLAKAGRLLDREDVRSAAAAYESAVAAAPPGMAADLWFSRRLLSLALSARSPAVRAAAFQRGYKAARRATETAEDRANAWYNLAMFTAALEDRASTEENLRRAIAAAPNWFKPHWALAQALLLSGRLEEAEREAQIAARLAAGKFPEVAATLEKIRAARAETGGG